MFFLGFLGARTATLISQMCFRTFRNLVLRTQKLIIALTVGSSSTSREYKIHECAPNYAIKRDLRANTAFIFHIGRVGPLFWLLEPKKQNAVKALIS